MFASNAELSILDRLDNPFFYEAGMAYDMKAIVQSDGAGPADTGHLHGQAVWITRVVYEPMPEVEGEALPMFNIIDPSGRIRVLFPEELRVVGLAEQPEQKVQPGMWIDGLPITNLHPFVYKTLLAPPKLSDGPGIIPEDAASSIPAIIEEGFQDTFDIQGRTVWIIEAITEPEYDADEGHMPMFRVKDRAGQIHTLLPEELRVEGECPEQAKNPAIMIGDQPITNLHPFVYQTMLTMPGSKTFNLG